MTTTQDWVLEAAKAGDCGEIRRLLSHVDPAERHLVLGVKKCNNGETVAPLHVAAVYSQIQASVRLGALWVNSATQLHAAMTTAVRML